MFLRRKIRRKDGSKIVAVFNSRPQRGRIEAEAVRLGLHNVRVATQSGFVALQLAIVVQNLSRCAGFSREADGRNWVPKLTNHEHREGG